jgi:Relaxase/Mobilisation nuclease domain.
MISKHVPMRSIQKSSMGELVRYITSSQGKQERVGEVTITNCHSIDPQDAIREMLAVQACNTRTKDDKNYHLLVSFADGERPSADVLRAIEARLCDAMGFGEHQRISAVHHDTDHVHIHIAINKIHPERHTVHTPYYDKLVRSETCQALEREFGLVRVDHAGRKTAGQGRAADMEHHAGIESLMSWARRECLPRLSAAQTWAYVHQVLREHDLVLRPRGNGLVIETAAGLQVKASSIDRTLGKAQLETRLGQFEPGAADAAKATRSQYQARPIGYQPEANSLFQRYQAEKQSARKNSGAALQQAQAQRAAALDALQRRSSLRRAAIRLMPAAERRLLYQLASQSTQRERAAIQQTFQRSRHNTGVRHPRLTWADWLRHQAGRGDAQALRALRTRDMKARPAMRVPPARGRAAPVGRTPPPLRSRLRPFLRLVQGKTPVPAVGAKPPQGQGGRLRPLSSLRSIVQLGVVPLQAVRAALQPSASPATPAKPYADIKAQQIQGTAPGQPSFGHLLTKDSTTKQGTIIFRAGSTAVRDDGKRFQVSRGATDDGLRAALTAAAQRFGSTLKVDGSDAFKQNLIRVAAKHAMPLTFADPAMERERQRLTPRQGDTYVERAERQRTDRRDDRRTGTDTGRRAAVSPLRDGAGTGRSGRGSGKPDVAAVGSQPPPQSQHRLRDLSQLGVVHHPGGSEVLLPRDVPHHVEQQGADPVHGLRRPLHRAGGVSPDSAVDTYIAGREALRSKGLDIPAHRRYTGSDAGNYRYAGVRQVDGQHMVLLEQEKAVLVLPITDAQLPRMKRRRIGESVTVSKDGAIKSKGRSKGAGV